MRTAFKVAAIAMALVVTPLAEDRAAEAGKG
jgi:hypothetical protein